MHTAHIGSELTPYQVVGQLSRLKLDGERPNDIRLEAPETWNRDSFAKRHDALSDLVERVGLIGPPGEHVWRGVGISSILPTDVDRLTARIADLSSRIVALPVKLNDIPAHLELKIVRTTFRERLFVYE